MIMRKTTMAAVMTATIAAAIGLAIAPASASGRLIPPEWIVSGNTNADSHYNASGTTITSHAKASDLGLEDQDLSQPAWKRFERKLAAAFNPMAKRLDATDDVPVAGRGRSLVK